MGTYVKKAIHGVSYESLFVDCVIILEESHKAGDIISDRIILTDTMWYKDTIPSKEELDNAIYDKGYAVRAVRIDLVDDIETCTDMTPYGFTKVDENRYCKSNESIYWAKMETDLSKLPKHKPTEEELKFWME